jgi:hypothetical protein
MARVSVDFNPLQMAEMAERLALYNRFTSSELNAGGHAAQAYQP